MTARSPDLRSRTRRLPFATRLHIRGRLRSCPFDAVAREVPVEGLVVSIGCGHGVFETRLAEEAPGRSILAGDTDPGKIDVARRLSHGLRRVRFVVGDPLLALEPGERPAVVLAVDVFYLIPYDAQVDLIRRARRSLGPGGLFLLKEMRETPRAKASWNRVQETLAVKVLRITRGGRFYFRRAEEWIELFRAEGYEVEETQLHAGYFHPHTLFRARAV